MGTDPENGWRVVVLKFRIEPSIFEVFPGLCIGLMLGQDVDNHGDSPDILEKIRKIQSGIRRDYAQEILADCPKIQNWHKAFQAFGAKPKKHRSSVENLYRMTLDGVELRPINKLVDIYNYVSLLHVVPVGGDDLARVEGNIFLKFAQGNETFVPLGADNVQTPRRGEVIYADDRDVLCRRWNWRESEKTKMSEETRDVLLVCEGLPPVNEAELDKAVRDLARQVGLYCGGRISTKILSADVREWEF
jgi:lysyl-tRNA synthetase class 2